VVVTDFDEAIISLLLFSCAKTQIILMMSLLVSANIASLQAGFESVLVTIA
jgi:hypothetical protein